MFLQPGVLCSHWAPETVAAPHIYTPGEQGLAVVQGVCPHPSCGKPCSGTQGGSEEVNQDTHVTV